MKKATSQLHVGSQNLFFRLFPVPEFLLMPAAGVEVSEKAVRFVQLVREGKVIRVKTWGELKLPPGVVQSGEILQPEELKKILSSIKTTYKVDRICATLPEEKAYMFTTKIPVADGSNIRESVDFVLEENVPISRKEAVFDVVELKRENFEKVSVCASVIPSEVANNYASVFTESGLVPVLFQVESQAMARAIIPQGDEGVYMIVNFGVSKTNISIVSGGIVEFASVVNIGGEDLTALIQKYLHVTEEEAERIKMAEGLVRRPDNELVFNSIISAVTALKDEINRLSTFWTTHQDDQGVGVVQKIEKIILCGKDSLMEGFDDYIASSLKMHVEIANTWVNVSKNFEFVPEISHEDSLNFAAAIGLALQKI